ncbi:aspartyl/asparaginyl beta-hydroxylase domain-containing protein [Methyloceanibacter sp. wino2]|uniref:aspartyl/asparaginyl beta-hydroxylase domain-containing protein n=1 Tax=Methyloceanibacter sp. wino2 TaxID=2170729 RepID=UPI000D3E8816|nr:aspartyl/asparaginyl beta-hydroxylase domain-containing protein [Methyloceanibacter sp. wino2]
MERATKKAIRRFAIAGVVLFLGLVFLPLLTIFYLGCGLIDVMRNKRRDAMVFRKYFLGNGITTWLLSPLNLFIDLFSYHNKGVYKLDDLPPEWREEVDQVLDVFREQKDTILTEIDESFEDGRRGMYVYEWYGKRKEHSVEALKRDYKYVKTVAVSVFSGKESTSFHYGPLRMTLRVLYNLTPVDTDQVYIQCGWEKHFWRDDPLYIFDDTLIHRSVNDYDARRFVVFMDIMRPTAHPAFLNKLIAGVSVLVERANAVFYKNWKMLRPGAKSTEPPAPRSEAA